MNDGDNGYLQLSQAGMVALLNLRADKSPVINTVNGVSSMGWGIFSEIAFLNALAGIYLTRSISLELKNSVLFFGFGMSLANGEVSGNEK